MKAVIIAGGDQPPTTGRGECDRAELVIAADQGYEHACNLGVRVDVLVGDLDSISPQGRAHAQRSDVEIQCHPTDKDASDLDLAVQLARHRGADEIVVLSGGDGRLDHQLGVMLQLSTIDIPTRAHIGSALVQPCHESGSVTVHGAVGSVVSLFAVGGTASGVCTSGLRWELDNASLSEGSTRGLSNELAAETGTVSCASGCVLVIQPEVRSL